MLVVVTFWLFIIIVRIRMSGQLPLFKYLQLKPAKKLRVAEDAIDLVITESVHRDVQMYV